MAGGRIFVCYRREDTAGHAGRLYDRLNNRFTGRVFMDVASIGLGTRWAKVIEETLRSCEVAIILIGNRWLEPGQGGARRIDRPDDPTRAEIATALRLNLKIVPLLVSGAAVPEAGQLPPDVAAIAEWQALRVDDDDFDHDATRLIRALEHQLGDHEAPPRPDTVSPKPAEAQRLVADAEPAIDQPTTRLRRRGFFGFSMGSLRIWVTIGVAAVAIVAVRVGGFLPASPSPMSTARQTPVQAESGSGGQGEAKADPAPASPGPTQVTGRGGVDAMRPPVERPNRPEPADPAASIAGEYTLVSYRERGVLQPVTGAMRLTEKEPGRYEFETVVRNRQVQGAFQYHGVLFGGGTNWTVTTRQTNDPNVVVAMPVATHVRVSGTTLAMQNGYGQAAVWRKR